MSLDLPPLDALGGATPAAIFGQIVLRAEPVRGASFEFGWQRDRAYVEAIDDALRDVAAGASGLTATIPSWFEPLLRRELRACSEEHQWDERFVRTRLLERLGLVDLQPDDTYVLAMVSALGHGKAAKLRSDQDLVERAVWRLFEVEGGGEVSLTNVDRFGGDEWRAAFVELVADGTLERSRVLSGCLDALGRDFAAYRARWFAATFHALQPTLQERAALQPALRRLLSAAVPATVAFALRELEQLHGAALLDAAETLEALPPAVLVGPKGTALSALRLASGFGPDHQAAVVTVATAALGHPHAEVQRSAASILEACGAVNLVRASRGALEPSVQHDLGFVLETASHDRALPTQPLAAVPPPVTRPELAERTARLLEDSSDPLELEVVLAALVAPGSEDVLRPLLKRARSIVARGPGTDFGDSWLPGQVARLVLTLLGEPAPPADPEAQAARFLVRRLDELRHGTAPLLATPDLAGGRLSANAFVGRLALNSRPRHHDVIAALLRLQPDEQPRRTTNDLHPALRFALDGVEPKKRVFGARHDGPAAWWIAARRARSPYADVETPLLTGETRTSVWQQDGRERRSRYAAFEITGRTTGPAAADRPTEIAADLSTRLSAPMGDWVPALAAEWPLDAEHFLALTASPVLEAPAWTDVAHDVPLVLDALARHPGRMGELAVHVLAAGISAAHRDYRIHAVDAFLDLVATGRVPAPAVAAVMARYAEAWPATRWAESLAAVAQDPRGAAAVIELLTALLPQLPPDHRGLNVVLDLLRDQTLRGGLRVADPALVAWLGRFAGSSAASATARALLR